MTRANSAYYTECNCTGTGASDFLGHDLDCNIVERASAMAENYRNFSHFIWQSEAEVACTCSEQPHTPACYVIQNAEILEQAALIV